MAVDAGSKLIRLSLATAGRRDDCYHQIEEADYAFRFGTDDVGTGKPTVAAFVAAAESISDLDLGIGSSIGFARNRHQAASQVWGTVLDGAATYQMLDLGAGP